MQAPPGKLTVLEVDSFHTDFAFRQIPSPVLQKQTQFKAKNNAAAVAEFEKQVSPATDELQKKLTKLQKETIRLNIRVCRLQEDLERVDFWQKAMTSVGILFLIVSLYKSQTRR